MKKVEETDILVQEEAKEKSVTLSAEDVTNIMNYLGEIPAKFANPIINFLGTKQNEQ